MRMLPGSAFMPPELVEWSFEQLVVTFPENAILYKLLKYWNRNKYFSHECQVSVDKFKIC